MSSNVLTRADWARLQIRALRTRSAQWLASTTYARKWLVLGIIIGVIAGLGAVVFYEALRLATYVLLEGIGGYTVPTPVSEGGQAASAHFTRPWAIPLVVCGGALAGALLVFGIAPEAKGHGTDAAISAVHHNPRGIRFRTVIVKIVASALTIGSGGSAGREGPTGQISAGFGSYLARFFDLGPADARIAVASGIGSGIGSIFGAPLGGAVLATEVVYRDDFEVEALLPAFIASITGYVVWGSIEGFGPLFGYVGNYRFTNASQLIWFGLIGILGGLVGLLYAKGFYGIAAFFEGLALPRWMRPALGGLLVGCIALVIPEVLGTGFGWIQQALGPALLQIPLWIVLVLPVVHIATTGLSIGSGGSGGIFGPGMVIGAFIGAGVWRLFEPIAPGLGSSPAPYVIVGMMCCFGSISRAPLAVMLMVAEMTGNLTMLVPAMIAVGLATLIVRHTDATIYISQLRSRAESPAHRILAGLPLLAVVPASDAMARPRCVLTESTDLEGAERQMVVSEVRGAPFVDAEGHYVGTITLGALHEAILTSEVSSLGGLADTSVLAIHEEQHLDVVLDVLTSTPQNWVPIIDDERRVAGTISMSDIVRSYRRALEASVRRVAEIGATAGAVDIVVADDTAIDGIALRAAGLPRGVLITAIERDHELIAPAGDTILRPGDRIMALGSPEDLDRLRRLTASSQ